MRAPADATAGPRGAWLWLLFAVLQLVPIWSGPYFATLDGPAHVGNMLTYLRLEEPGFEVLRRLYEPVHAPAPNYFVYLFLGAALPLVGPAVAEKLFLSLYALALPLALRYALGAFGGNATVFAWLGFPMAYSTILFLGFYNTAFAQVAFLAVIGFWLRHRAEASVRLTLAYAALAGFCYLVHLSALALSAAFIAIVGLRETFSGARSAGARAVWGRFVARCLLPGVAYIVPVAAAVVFLLRPVDAAPTSVGDIGEPVVLRLARLLNGPIALAYDPLEWLIVFPFLGGIVFAGLVLKDALPRRALIQSALFAAVAGFLLLYLLLPYRTGVRWIPFRIVPYVYLALLLWLGAASGPLVGRARRLLLAGVTTAALLATAATAILRPLAARGVNELLAEYVSAAAYLAPGSVVLPVVLGNTLDGRPMSGYAGIDVFYQAQHYLAWEKPIGLLLNGQASVNYFPIVFRRAVNPFIRIDRLLPEFRAYRSFDLDAYRRDTGVAIDAVLLWGDEDFVPPAAEAATSPFFAQLAADYVLVYRSPGRGLQRVYRRRP